MWRIAPLVLLVVGCAAAPQRADFVEQCTARFSDKPDAFRDVLINTCVDHRLREARAEHDRATSRFGTMAAAIILGAGSDALATHNFYVYRVPEARRYLRR